MNKQVLLQNPSFFFLIENWNLPNKVTVHMIKLWEKKNGNLNENNNKTTVKMLYLRDSLLLKDALLGYEVIYIKKLK